MENCPEDIQDVMYQSIDEIGMDYGKLRTKVIA